MRKLGEDLDNVLCTSNIPFIAGIGPWDDIYAPNHKAEFLLLCICISPVEEKCYRGVYNI